MEHTPSIQWPYSPYRPLASSLRFRNSSFSWCGVVSPTPNPPNLEDQVSLFMTPGDRVSQLYPRTLGSSGFSGVPLPVPTIVGPSDGRHCCLIMTCEHICTRMTDDATMTWNHIITRMAKDATVTSDRISARTTYMMWREEH
jgi:hypothetical protein